MSDQPQHGAGTRTVSPWWQAALTLMAALVGGVLTSIIQYRVSSRDQDIKLVEVGLNILRAPATEDQISPAREWAIRLVESNSGIIFSSEDRDKLLKTSIASEFIPNMSRLLSSPLVYDGDRMDGPAIDFVTAIRRDIRSNSNAEEGTK